MSSVNALDYGASGALRFARNTGRSLTSESLGSIRYPSPFFDIAHTYLPTSFKSMLRWCRYYFLTHPIINAVCYKKAEYPVTDLILDGKDESQRTQWEYLFNTVFNYKKFEIEVGLDTECYGNSFVSISYPFRKLLMCSSCRRMEQVERVKYVFRDFKFVGKCRSCGHYGEFVVRDHYVRSVRELRLIRWNPEYITIQHNEATAEDRYYYTVPVTLANDIRLGKRHVIERTPQIFMEALRLNKSLLFSKGNLFHIRRPTIAQKDRGWGMPAILPVLKDAFYLQVLRKSQEAISIEHIVPLRLLFPQTASGSADVYCVSLDTLVETSEGLLPAREVNAGYLVKTHSGNWKAVEAVADRLLGKSKAYKLTAAGLTAFPSILSEEHPVLAAKRGKRGGYAQVQEPDWLRTEELEVGDYVLYPTKRRVWEGTVSVDLADCAPDLAHTEEYLYRKLDLESACIYEFLEAEGSIPAFERGRREAFLAEKNWSLGAWTNARQAYQCGEVDRIPRHVPVTKELAYAIGIFVARGGVSDSSVNFAVHQSRAYLADVLQAIFSRLGFLRKGPLEVRPNSENGITIKSYDTLLGNFLTHLCGRGALNKRLPKIIQEAPGEIAMEAVRGLMQEDGSNIRTTMRRVGFSSMNPNLVMGVRQILLSEGFIPVVSKGEPAEESYGQCASYNLNLNEKQAESLAARFGWEQAEGSWGGSQVGFIRDGYLYLRVRAKEQVLGVPIVRGFQVEGDKSFCVAGVATHNSSMNLLQWRDKIEQEIIRWRLDNNYIPIMPVPVGQQTLGGDGRSLMLNQEYRVWSEHIVVGMHTPVEFVFGGVSYSASNVTLRMLENHFLEGRSQRLSMVRDFIIPGVSSFMGWTPINARYKRFKMADDLQRSAFNLQLNQGGKLSDYSMMEDLDWDAEVEAERIAKEQKKVLENQRSQATAQAAIQGEAQLVGAKYQIRAQKFMQEQMPAAPMMPGAPGQEETPEAGMPAGQGEAPGQMPQAPQIPDLAGEQGQGSDPMAAAVSPLAAQQQPMQPDLLTVARKIASWLDQLPDNEKMQSLDQLHQQNPQLHQLVIQFLEASRGAELDSSAAPLPNERAPRRGPEATIV